MCDTVWYSVYQILYVTGTLYKRYWFWQVPKWQVLSASGSLQYLIFCCKYITVVFVYVRYRYFLLQVFYVTGSICDRCNDIVIGPRADLCQPLPASAAISVPGWCWVSWGRQNTALWAADHQLALRRVKAAHWPIGRPVVHPLQRGTPADCCAVVRRYAGPAWWLQIRNIISRFSFSSIIWICTRTVVAKWLLYKWGGE